MASFIRLTPIDIDITQQTKTVPKEHYAAYLDARVIVEKAQKKAAEIIANAEKKYVEEQKRGYDEGIEEGKREVALQMLKTVERTVNFLQGSEVKITEIVMMALERILGELPPQEVIIKIIRNALDSVRNEKQITLNVSTKEVEMVKNHIRDISSDYPAIDYIDVVPDSRLKEGDCIIKSEIGVIEASLSKQLANLDQAFKKSLGVKVENNDKS